MIIGPIQTSIIKVTPLKQLQAQAPGYKTRILFDTTRPHAVASEAFAVTVPAPIFSQDAGGTLTGSRAKITQLLELARNPEWQQCGVYVTFDETTGLVDSQDGWYIIQSTSISEESITQGWATGQFEILQRGSRLPAIGVWFDSKLKPNNAGLGNFNGISLTAFPAGIDVANIWPVATWTLVGRDGNILVVENAGTNLRAPLLTPTDTMTKNRCFATDENVGGTISTEIFWKDHLTQNGYTRITNGLLRWTLHMGDAGPLVEAWIAGAWTTVGNFTLQSYNGTTYSTLPLQSYEFITISPEEIEWYERHYDATSTSFVICRNRIRRGSRIVESQIVGVSGLGVSGALSISFTNAPLGGGAYTAARSNDNTAAVFVNANVTTLPGFLYLDSNAIAPSVSGQQLGAGLTVAAGAVANIGILVGVQGDAIWTAMAATATPAAPTVGHSGTAGTTTRGYKVTAVNQYGVESVQSTETQDTTGFATLGVSNFEVVTMPAKPAGWASWNVYRTTAGGTPATTGLVSTGFTGAVLNDTGLPIITATSQSSRSVAYGNRFAAYNRLRIRQRLLIGI